MKRPLPNRKSAKAKDSRPLRKPGALKMHVRIGRWSYWAWTALVIVMTLFGAWVGWLAIRPNISISVLPVPGGGTRRLSPHVIISNSGYLTAKRVHFGCIDGGLYSRDPGAVWIAPSTEVSSAEREQYGRVVDIPQGDQVTYDCIMNAPSPGFHRIPGSFIIVMALYAEPPLNSHASFAQKFVSHLSEDGTVYWTPDGPGVRIYDFSLADTNTGEFKDADITNQVYDHPDNITLGGNR